MSKDVGILYLSQYCRVEQRVVENDAVYRLIHLPLEIFEEAYDNILLSVSLNRMIQSCASCFFCCLRRFYALTLHVKVKAFKKYDHNVDVYNCPIGPGAEKWREYHELFYLIGGKSAKSYLFWNMKSIESFLFWFDFSGLDKNHTSYIRNRSKKQFYCLLLN